MKDNYDCPFMMLDLFRARRSIQKYKAQAIESEHIELLKEAVVRSPTSLISGSGAIFITDKVKLKALSRAKSSGSSFLKGAGLDVVICADEHELDVGTGDCSHIFNVTVSLYLYLSRTTISYRVIVLFNLEQIS
jgi:hypothetical protein